jgi:SAM-dependent methyltransferase
MAVVNKEELEAKVKEIYKEVARNPHGDFHFEMGRILAEKLGYFPEDLDQVPRESIDSFAGVGYHFGLANIQAGEKVLDLGSGSGMDVFVAALKAGGTGNVTGLDMTEEQLKKSEDLRLKANLRHVTFHEGYIESLPFEDKSFDVVISNGVINLSAEKEKVFQEIGRVLRSGGRLAISDIVTDKELTEEIILNADLWASCIGGAMQRDLYRESIEDADMRILKVQENPQYQFLSKSALGATKSYGVRSISLLAEKIGQ